MRHVQHHTNSPFPRTTMSSTADTGNRTLDPRPSPMDGMLELMRDIRDLLLREYHKKHKETETCQNAPRSESMPGQDTVQQPEQNITGTSFQKPSTMPTKRFGVKKEHVRTNPVALANTDYRLKYPQDGWYHEHDPDARVWRVYLDEAATFDNEMVGELGDSLDVLLLFAGLFSAVVTTFVAQTSQALSVDNVSLSTAYLGEITTILRAGGNVSAISQISTTDTAQFSPTTGDIWVNGLWFTSLTIALSIALFAVLAKEWLRQYMSIGAGTHQDRTFIRQFRFDGFKAWQVQGIIGVLPVLLHLSLILFLIGLVVFLAPLNVAIAYTTGIITVTVVVLFLAASVLPLYVIQCPYRTTFSDLLYYMSQLPRMTYDRFLLPIISTSSNVSSNVQHTRDSKLLKDIEHHEACLSKDRQDLIFAALWWLGKSTSNFSAKEIIFYSLGAFAPRMTSKLRTREAIRVLYGRETFVDVWSLSLHRFDDHREILRSMIHLVGSIPPLEGLDRTKNWDILPAFDGEIVADPLDLDFALAFWASNVPTNLKLSFGAGYIKPSEGLSWVVNQCFMADIPIEVKVPPLVWWGLFKVSSNKKFKEAFHSVWSRSQDFMERSDPIACPVPIQTLVRLAEETKSATTNVQPTAFAAREGV
ncbi:hypothetical protein FB446DRAFT_758467 [Lentinula raphanica]|nr:hypothetical protein FB446DRAFT_758467 [Lentinula raphanica]